MKNSKKLLNLKNKQEAYLFGPFVGELTWEFYRFAPYAIHLKKTNPDVKIIVLTRQDRFDLYGQYASILVPLNIKDESKYKSSEFGLLKYKTEYYETIKKYFFEKYNDKYYIIDHFAPTVHGWRRKMKWQLPRSKMDYDFKPRKLNVEIVNGLIGNYSNMAYIDVKYYNKSLEGYINITSDEFLNRIVEKVDNLRTSYLGCLITLLRQADFTVSNLDSPVGHLSLLLGIPLISVNEKLTNDAIRLLNPLDTQIIKCTDVEEGVREYENNFRSKKSWPWKQWGLLYTREIRQHFS